MLLVSDINTKIIGVKEALFFQVQIKQTLKCFLKISTKCFA